MSEMNEDFEVNIEASAAPQELPEEEPAKKAPAKKAAPKKQAAKKAAPKKRGRPIIVIEEEEGRSNYEMVGVNGVEYRIMRGVEVTVPEEVVNVLKNAVATHYTPTFDPQNQQMKLNRTERSSIPWRIVGYENEA